MNKEETSKLLFQVSYLIDEGWEIWYEGDQEKVTMVFKYDDYYRFDMEDLSKIKEFVTEQVKLMNELKSKEGNQH